jgi:hypothetical protein
MTPHEIDALIAEAFPESFLRALVQSVFTARALAWEDARQFAQPEAENVRPWIARAHLEGLMRAAAERFPELTTSVQRASNWNHTEVSAGRLVLTQNSVPTPCAMVDASNFRMRLAENNSQLSLLPESEPSDPATFLVLLLHSQYRSLDPSQQEANGHLAGSAYLAVPARNLSSYIYKVNLFDRFPDLVGSYLPSDWADDAVASFLSKARSTGVA